MGKTKKKKQIFVAVDFDGTCVTHEYPAIGEDIGAQPVLKRLVENDVKLILFTMRSGETLDAAVKWFEDNDIELFGINTNPTQKEWTDSPKAYAQCYIDDAALGMALRIMVDDDGEMIGRPFVDWFNVEIWLEAQGFLPHSEVINNFKFDGDTKLN